VAVVFARSGNEGLQGSGNTDKKKLTKTGETICLLKNQLEFSRKLRMMWI
jgi:hypothetical protein